MQGLHEVGAAELMTVAGPRATPQGAVYVNGRNMRPPTTNTNTTSSTSTSTPGGPVAASTHTSAGATAAAAAGAKPAAASSHSGNSAAAGACYVVDRITLGLQMVEAAQKLFPHHITFHWGQALQGLDLQGRWVL